jgi:hypothetical protein
MHIRALLAAATIALPASLAAGPAAADEDFDAGIEEGLHDYFPGAEGGYDTLFNGFNFRAISCRQAEEAVRWRGFRKIEAIDCGLPTYRFTGWRDGIQYTIRVNGRGAVTRISRR